MLAIDTTLGALCLAILDGDAGAIGILADRMEEVGKEYHAAHVRRRKRLTRDTKVKIVTLALPDPAADLAACGFAEHVLPVFEESFRFEHRPRRGVETRRAWLCGELPRTELEALLPEMYSFYRTVLEPFRTVEGYRRPLAAAQAAVSAYGLVFSRPDIESEASCAASGGGYHAATLANWAMAAAGDEGREAERAWQLAHLQQVIQLLCGFHTDPIPSADHPRG